MKYKLKDLIQPISNKFNFAGKSNVIFLNTSDIYDGHISGTKIKTQNLPGQAKKSLKNGDILFSEIRPKNKRFAIVKNIKAEDYVVSTKLMVLRNCNSNILDTRYFYFYLTSPIMISYLQSEAESRSGTFPQITFKDTMADIEINLPPLFEQKLVVKRIETISSEIYINNQINDNLFELISSIWKKQSSDIHNKITLKRLAKRIITGKTPSTKIKENYGIDIPFVKIPDMHNKIFIDKTSQNLSIFGANSQKNKYVPKNSIIVSCIGTPGLVSLIGRTVQTNQQINSLILDNKYIYCTYLELKSLKYKIRNLGSGGTTIQNLNKTNFGNIKITVPNKDSQLDNFNRIAKPIFERIHVNNIELQNLVKIKEVLLGQYF